MTTDSPFSQNRFEYEEKHLYFLPDRTLASLRQQKPLCLIGSRGAGKTTLLKALCAEEQMKNLSLQKALGQKPLADHQIGIYLKVSELSMKAFHRWLESASEDQHGELLTLYFDLSWLEIACRLLVEMIAFGLIHVDPPTEHELVRRVLEDNEELETFDSSRPITLLDLGKRFKKMRVLLDRSSRVCPPVEEVAKHLPLGQIGHLGRTVGTHFCAFCDQNSEGKRWVFKVCYDEAESLSSFGIVAMNTIMRLARFPVFPILSFVRQPSDSTTTLLGSGMDLQAADREIVQLDSWSDSDFKQLAAGVASVRIDEHLPEAAGKFNLEALLGSLNLNAMLTDALRRSEGKSAKHWLKRAKELQSENSGAENEQGENEVATDLPILESYLFDRLNLRPLSSSSHRWEHRALDSQEIRKRAVAAYLVLFNELGQHPRYAFSEMLIQMSDNCIRDFLNFLDGLFLAHRTNFLNGSRISPEDQNLALKAASDKKRESLHASGVSAPSETKKIVEALGHLTQVLQAGSGIDSLRSSERGQFVIESSIYSSEEEEEEDQETLSLLIEAADTGYLRILDSEPSKIIFRMHTSLSASFGFSYRGAYYATAINIRDITRIRNAPAAESLNSKIKRLSTQVTRTEELPLFGD